MTILEDFADALIFTTAHRMILDEDPRSSTYGDTVPGPEFTIGHTQLSGTQRRNLGMEMITKARQAYADREGEALNVSEKERLVLADKGSFDVISVEHYEDQLGFDGIAILLEDVS